MSVQKLAMQRTTSVKTDVILDYMAETANFKSNRGHIQISKLLCNQWHEPAKKVAALFLHMQNSI